MFSKNSALILVLSSFCLLGCSRSRTPDIVLITVDTLRADRVGCYGYEPARTPSMDRLASEGVRVEHAIAPAPLTLPSHTSILTGLEPPAHGVRDNGTFRVPDAAQTLAERLKAEGYQTQAFVSSEVLHRRFNLNQGFDGYDDDLWNSDPAADFMMRQRSGERTMDRVLEWLGERSSSSGSASPFFLWVHLFDPHEPYDPPEMDAKLSPTPYDGEIASADRQIGRLLEALDQADRLDDTIVVLTSDHGESLGEHEEGTHSIFIYESTVRVPLIFRYPRKLPANEVYRGSARSTDIMPTILGLAGKGTEGTQGTNLSKALAKGQPDSMPLLYSESLHPELVFGMAPLEGVRRGKWTYIRAPRPELYDREADPDELRNLLEAEASDSAKAQALELDALLTKILEQSKDFGLSAEVRPLDEETVKMLQALGYMETSEASDDLKGMDPKDGLRIFDDVNRAVALTQGNDCAAAAKILTSVLEQLPTHVRARNAMAKCEVRMGNPKAARDNYLASLAYQPRQPQVLLQLGRLELAQGHTKKAREYFSKALQLMPESVEAMMLMGYIEFSEGQPAKATRWYSRAIAADPERPDAYVQQGDLYFRKQKFGEARVWYEKALAVAPQSYGPSLQAGLCCLSLGDWSAANAHLSRAKELNPNRWQPLYGLACIQAHKGDVNAAFGLLEDAVNKGFADGDRIRRDQCLAPLSDDPRFARLLGRLNDTTRP
ncbi:MAG: sulfatase-like hydrolase/transferase [Myxococcales bacterium]